MQLTLTLKMTTAQVVEKPVTFNNSPIWNYTHLDIIFLYKILDKGNGVFKVAPYSFSGSIPSKFERKLRRDKQRFGKIATTVVLGKDENLLLSGLQRHRSRHSNAMTLLSI